MKIQQLLELINNKIEVLSGGLKAHQLEDNGFRGYLITDNSSGIWTTAEIIYILYKSDSDTLKSDLIKNALEYLLNTQNKDGGWGFRKNGKSIVDITAWACLALNQFENNEAILKGIEFILKARHINNNQCGWGLTNFEPARIFSSVIATSCLKHVLLIHEDWFSSDKKNEIFSAIKETKEWIIKSKVEGKGWGPNITESCNVVSSSLALICLFTQGEDPRNYKDVFQFIISQSKNDLWELEREIVITQEGYELTQEWFTSIYAFRSFIFFSELNICTLQTIHSVFIALIELIDNHRVRPATGASNELMWPIPLMIEGLIKFKNFVSLKKKEYEDFLYKKEIEEKKHKKITMENYLKTSFPYPISQVYFSFTREIDYHRRFQYLLQLNEVIVKYIAFVSLSTVIAANEKLENLKSFLENRFKRPSLGDFLSLIEMILAESEKINSLIHPWKKEDILRKQSNFLENEASKMNLNQSFSELVTLRNKWVGHGAVRSVYEYKMEIDNQIPNLFTLLNRFMFLAKCNSFLILSSDFNEFGDGDLYKIRLFNGLDIIDDNLEIQKRLSEGQKEQLIRYVYFHNTESNTIVNLYPFMSYMFCSECKKERFFFYNGSKTNEIVEYLSFECGHTIENENLNHFSKRFSAIDVSFY